MPSDPLPPGVYEEAYLASDDPRAQSGFRGDEARWESARRPIVEAIDCDGSFLDIGCANGYLLESIVRWSRHRLEPYGLDFAPELVELARNRLPRWADRIFLGDALTWEPPRSFEFARTELVYVPEERRPELVERLLSYVDRLIVCSYGSRRRSLPAEDVGEQLRSLGFDVAGELEREGCDGALIRLAWIGGSATA
ncbi:MAG: SAM-dependent methyltransferase [Actinobacteria bacterium]|nr:MAG: SAM-dependent methyltransferase [Actinomycetota bacterium]